MKTFCGLVLLILGSCTSVFADSPFNAWTNATSGNWENPKWSLGVRPGPGQTITLTNQGWKAIAIRASTAQNFPESLNVANVIVSGYTDSFNVLLLNYAGTDVPLRAANGFYIDAGGEVQNLYSGLIVDSGDLTVSNSQFIQVGGFVATTNAWLRLDNGAYNLTNGLLQAGQVNLGLNNTASFVQDGGTANMTNLRVGKLSPGGNGQGTSVYDLFSGYLYVSGTLTLGAVQASGVFNQHGGTNYAALLDLEPPFAAASVTYNLSGGMLTANDVHIFGAGNACFFNQTGGDAFITNTLALRGGTAHGQRAHEAYYQLYNGTLSARSLDINGGDGYSVYTQSNGTVRIAENVYLGGGSYLGNLNLAGGTLTCSNIYSSAAGVLIVQTGGALIVSNVFSYGGQFTPWGGTPSYFLNGGTLTASNMELFAEWRIGSSTQAGRIINPGWFKMGFTTLRIGDADEHLGRFILATSAVDPGSGQFPPVTNSVITLDGSSSRLSFADSSAESWAPGTILVINNWNGNPSGGGAEQLKFGTSAAGLRPDQLSKIRFNNPAGLSAGTYPARILASGEIVPASSGQNNSTVNAWTKATSGSWEEPYWSLGILPATNQSILFTNAGSKALSIGLNTAQNFPASMNVGSITVSSPQDSHNVLLLDHAGYDSALRAGSLTINTNAALTLLGSVLSVTNTGTPSDRLVIGGTVNEGYYSAVRASYLGLGDAGPGVYNLTNGLITVSTGYVSSGGIFNHLGGYSWGDQLTIAQGGQYNLYDGAFGGNAILNGGTFHQTGGLFNAGLSMNGTYLLDGGTFSTPSMDFASAGHVYQSGGNARIGELTISGYNLGYSLGGGLLSVSNLTLLADFYTIFQQTGGSNVVGNLLRVSGGSGAWAGVTGYFLSGGTLSAPVIELANGTQFHHTGGAILNNQKLMIVSGMWEAKEGITQLGQLDLSGATTNPLLIMPAGASVLGFAASSSINWKSGATLFMFNWAGSLSGGGQHQITFGPNGLTAHQVSRIRFFNPAGLPPGTYPAEMLASGEVVPTVSSSAPSISAEKTDNGLVLSWPSGYTLQSATNVAGPYMDVNGATSPYTNNFTEPQRYFRLRQ